MDLDALEHLLRSPDPIQHTERVFSAFLEAPFHLTLPQVLSAESILRVELPPVPVLEPVVPHAYASARDIASEVEVLVDATGSEPPAGELADFVRYFNDRYDTLAKLVRRRREVANALPIARLKDAGREAQVIGLVDEVSRNNKNGNRFLELEDSSGRVTVFIPSKRPDLVELSDTILPDEVIGVAGKMSTNEREEGGGLLIAENIVRPDLPHRADTRPGMDVAVHAAFLGDVHVGSKTFLPDPFRRMLRWLHGDEGEARERALAKSIKYLVLPGDVVDGVGVYPGQEESLAIPHAMAQYRALAKELESLPRHLHVVFLPGNHDASRPTEPQPAFEKEIRGYFDNLEATFVSNPSTFSLHGRRVLGYHGVSMVDFATTVPGMSLERPTEIMRQQLQCRHLAPTYGAKTPVSPDAKDRLLIGLEPDIFVTGHVHVVGLDRYKGVALVNGGTWQAQTSYQKMLNLMPTPAVMPVVNLSTLNATRVDFSSAP